MNRNKKILQFVLTIFVVLLLISVVTTVYSIQWKPLKNINILADVFNNNIALEKAKQKQDSAFAVINITPPKKGGDSLAKSFYHFFRKDRITSFYDDTDRIAMNRFILKLYELKSKKRKIRIAFLGDSMIEGDYISSTLRKLLQQAFGGAGVGFVPIETVADAVTVTTHHSDNWRNENFRSKQHPPLFLSGHVFFAAPDAWFSAKDNTVAAAQTLSKRLFAGQNPSCSITYNGASKTIQPDSLFNNILLDNNEDNNLKIIINNSSLPIYGVSFESEDGIIVDNFSFRGSGGNEFAKFDTSFLKSIAENNPYDLIIMQYGINLIENSTDTNFSWYYKPMKASVTKLQHCFPNADILILSTADRAFRYEDGMQTAVGIKNIIAMQEKIAYETNSSFYNMFSSMGGDGSMVKWVEEKPTLAYQDYMHPNSAGSAILGESIFEAIMHEYKKIKE